jgi:ATP-dependent DNA helicase RecQ
MSDGTVFDFAALQRLLLGPLAAHPPAEDVDQADDPILGRIRQILRARATRQWTGDADLVALVRHALMARSSATRRERLRIPQGPEWPGLQTWRRFSIHATSVDSDLLLEALPWRPAWLAPGAILDDDVFAEVFAGQAIRESAETPIDPCVGEASGYTAYVSPGQREAVRSLLYMPAGSTLVVYLPTGSGKTLVGQVPTLLGGLSSGLTLFVVPTTALAIDQARRMRELLGRTIPADDIPELAWYAGLPPAVKVATKRRIRAGNQGILFASPEAATGALLPVLYDAAAKGSLKYLVIDEAHMVAEWGDGFRPAFQALAGVRRGLLGHCRGEPFRTVLMSATLTPYTVATLDGLFGPAEMVQMVSAVHLRPEPRYWSYRAASWDEKVERVLALVRHTPRPFILYVTEPPEAREWLDILKQEGFVRVDCFHGKTLAAQREQIIQDWAQDRLDGIIATSAFGVGMDKPDVRTVTHATVPETLNRFYQEVGRGGRDGKASICVVVFTERDSGKARSLSRPQFIGDDNAFDRWRTMFMSGRVIEGTDLVSADITVPPPHLRQQTDYNIAWNMRTLILLARAGLIELDSAPPVVPERQRGETEEAYENRLGAVWEKFYSTITLRSLDASHLNKEHFEARIAEERHRGLQSADRSFSDLMAALEGRKEMGSVLAELYRSNAPERMVIVSRACRGCPADPSDSLSSYQIPCGIGISRIAPVKMDAWRDRFPWLSGTMATVLYKRESPELSAKLERALAALVGSFGLAEISAPHAAWRRVFWLRSIHRFAPTRMLVARTIEEDEILPPTLPLPRASLLWPWGAERIPNGVMLLDRPLHLILVPDDIPCEHPLRRYADTAFNTITLDNFLQVATR